MKVKDLKGREHTLTLVGYRPLANSTRPRSEFHVQARSLIKEEFPTDPILEELPVPGERLFCDFFLPRPRLVIEVHGQQHYKYNSMFHSSLKDFLAGRQNDLRKAEWCKINDLTLVILPYN